MIKKVQSKAYLLALTSQGEKEV